MFNPTLSITAIVLASLSLALTVGMIIHECVRKTSRRQHRKASTPAPENGQTLGEQQSPFTPIANPPPYTEREIASSLSSTDDADPRHLHEQNSDGHAEDAVCNTAESILAEWPEISTQSTTRR